MATAPENVFTQVYDEYYDKVFKYIFYRVGNPDVAEDLVSEVFEKVFLKYNTYDSRKARFSTWLFAIVNHTVINFYKKNTREAKLRRVDEMQTVYSLDDKLDDMMEAELKDLLIKSLRLLDEQQRNIIALKFGAGLKNREIAVVLGLTETNVGTIIYRTLQQLRGILKEHEMIS